MLEAENVQNKSFQSCKVHNGVIIPENTDVYFWITYYNNRSAE